MSKSQHKKHQSHPKHQNHPTHGKQHSNKPKERGWALTLAIIYVILHGLVLVGVVIGEGGLADLSDRYVMIIVVLLAGILGAISGILLWQWKQLGLTLYLIATLGAIIAGLLITGSMLFVFSAILPFAIVGYIVRMHWSNFE